MDHVVVDRPSVRNAFDTQIKLSKKVTIKNPESTPTDFFFFFLTFLAIPKPFYLTNSAMWIQKFYRNFLPPVRHGIENTSVGMCTDLFRPGLVVIS